MICNQSLINQTAQSNQSNGDVEFSRYYIYIYIYFFFYFFFADRHNNITYNLDERNKLVYSYICFSKLKKTFLKHRIKCTFINFMTFVCLSTNKFYGKRSYENSLVAFLLLFVFSAGMEAHHHTFCLSVKKEEALELFE